MRLTVILTPFVLLYPDTDQVAANVMLFAESMQRLSLQIGLDDLELLGGVLGPRRTSVTLAASQTRVFDGTGIKPATLGTDPAQQTVPSVLRSGPNGHPTK